MDTTIPAGTNTWYVIARNDCGTTRGPNWRFIVQSCLAPAALSGPVPANLAPLAAAPTLFNWADAARATSYDVYLDGTLVASGLTASQWACGTPISAGSHTWRVVAQNACGTTTGPLWNFTITCSRPAVPAGPTVPVNNAILSNAPTRLNWADTARATSYDVYLDGVLAVSGLTNSQWSCNIEIGAGVHRWYVVARNACGSTTGPVWTFTCAPPATPATPSPASGVVLSQSPTLLNWADTLRATSYDVYVDGVLAASGLTTSQYTVSERLSRATHTWYVVARNSCGTTRGPLWSFIIARTVTN